MQASGASAPPVDTLTEALCRHEAARCRAASDSFARWARGYGPIRHSDVTQWRVRQLVDRLCRDDVRGDAADPFAVLQAADRLTCAGLWLAVHQVYATEVHLDGCPLPDGAFKHSPQGHLGGVLNMVPAYVGYLAANALAGTTRSWLMGQGHCVGAIDCVNLLVGNTLPAQAARYAVDDPGLTRFVRDFYAYALDERGRQAAPIGSHVNAHTAGGLLEGGYLGFAELLYPHMPLPGDSLVAFLSDGAFEEQRGGDWAPRWWRPGDCGLVAPILIWNGRRIDQRTTMAQSGGTDWFLRHLRLHGFDPILLDGTDPASFVWAVFEIEQRERAAADLWRARPEPPYDLPLPYGVALAPKGWGFYGAGTNPAHNLPLPGNPREDAESARLFREHAARVHVPPDALDEARRCFARHTHSGRPRERDHPLAARRVRVEAVPDVESQRVPDDRRRAFLEAAWSGSGDAGGWTPSSGMDAVDRSFVAWTRANPHLRPRVGNPDEMRSNGLERTLESLHFRVTDPEPGIPESIDGAVVTALNEEAVCCAALGNKGGINLVATYEAFATKMFGVVRQEVIFTHHGLEAGHRPGWLSVPLVLTSHTWENGKNEASHQDPSMVECLLGEPSHVARALFPPDANATLALMEGVYRTHGQIWGMVVPKRKLPDVLTPDEARALLDEGACGLAWAGFAPERASLALVAIGAYQLREVLHASRRLAEREVPHRVVTVLEPGRFRRPRSALEEAHQAPAAVRARLFPDTSEARLFVAHTRPEPMLGVLGPLHEGTRAGALGYVGGAGTLDAEGMLFVNRTSWAHVLEAAARLMGEPGDRWLAGDEHDALVGRRSPMGVIVHREA